MLRMSSLVCAIALLAGPLVWAQQPDQPVFRSSVRTVPIYATVIDSGGRLVPDLEQADFAGDGQRQAGGHRAVLE